MPIFDQGYQHWQGSLSGHAWRWLAITRHGLRVALSGWMMRLVLIVAAFPAIILVFLIAMWGLLERQSETIAAILPVLAGILDPEILAGPRAYRVEIWTIVFSNFLATQQWFAMVLILFAGPNLISQDLRYNALPLYFSRPLRRFDYVVGKLGVIVALLSVILIVPVVAAYVLGLVFSLDLTILRDTFRILLASVAYGIVISISAGLLILALSSLSRNSRYVALFWIGMWFVTSSVAGVLWLINSFQQENAGHQARKAGQYAQFEVEKETAAKRDWRPLVSYTQNLSRIRHELLGTDAALEKFSRLEPEGQRDPILLSFRGPQFPWYWSAAVLVVWLILSICILNIRIKSLDSLR